MTILWGLSILVVALGVLLLYCMLVVGRRADDQAEELYRRMMEEKGEEQGC